MGLRIPLILMAIRSIASQILFVSEPRGVMTTLCFFLYWLWFGIGVEYPLSATIMSEYTNKKTQVAFTITVFAMQGWVLGSRIVAPIVSATFGYAYNAQPNSFDRVGFTVPPADYIWHIILMVGASRALLTTNCSILLPRR